LKKQRFKVAATVALTTTTTTTSTSTTTTLPFSTALISRDWTVPAASETYKCRRVQVPADAYIAGFRPSATAGTFQMLVTVEDTLEGGGVLGDYDCAAGASTAARGIFAAGLGTGDVTFPAGYGVRLRAGQYLNLELHLANADGSDLSGSSGVLVHLASADDVMQEVELVFSGTVAISLPSSGTELTRTGGCTASAGFQIVGLWPHMRALGVHAKWSLLPAGSTQVVLDAPFTVDAQPVHAASATVQAGDQIQSACTYVNSTGVTVNFGDSITDELCLIGMYRSPVVAGDDLYGCVSF
jgi:hypothetical protein